MALIPFTVTVIDHVNNPNNTLANTAIEIRTTQAGEPLAQIYSDDAGANPIPQPGAQTNNLGVFYFYAESEGDFDYKAISSGFSENISGNSHNKLTNRNAAGAHDEIYRRAATVAQIATGAFDLDTEVRIVDHYNLPAIIVNSGNVNNYNVFDAGAGKFAVLIQKEIPDTFVELEWYVDPILGTDEWGYGLGVGVLAYKTPQFAFDMLPTNISKEQVINLANGTYIESSRPPESMPRPAIFYPQGKYISQRTAQSSGELTGMVILRGESRGGVFINSDKDNGYSHSIYVSNTEVGIQDLTVSAATAGSGALITSHRGAYVHTKNIQVGSPLASLGFVCEAGAWAEIVGCNIEGCTGEDLVVYPDCVANVASVFNESLPSVVGRALVSGTLAVNFDVTFTENLRVTSGAVCTLAGSNLYGTVKVNCPYDAENAQGSASYTDFNDNVTFKGFDAKLTLVNWQKQMTAYGGSLSLIASKSFVSPNTQSDVDRPIKLRDGASYTVDNITEIRGSSGDLVGAEYRNTSVTVSSDGFIIPITNDGKTINLRIVGSGANRINCTLGDISGVLAGTPPADGTVLALTGAGFNTEIVDSANTRIAGVGKVTIGSQSGAYTGATFVFNADSGNRWELNSVGLQIP